MNADIASAPGCVDIGSVFRDEDTLPLSAIAADMTLLVNSCCNNNGHNNQNNGQNNGNNGQNANNNDQNNGNNGQNNENNNNLSSSQSSNSTLVAVNDKIDTTNINETEEKNGDKNEI